LREVKKSAIKCHASHGNLFRMNAAKVTGSPPPAIFTGTPPTVSILLPCLNSRRFLEERQRSIESQTFSDWELLIGDSGSTDGCRDFFEKWASVDPRVRVLSLPRLGFYDAVNRLAVMAGGRYLLIAPADDTMDDNFLQEMAAGLDANPQCGMAHCGLTIIDEAGVPHPGRVPWDRFYGTLYFGDWMWRPHIRLAPHDGLLCFAARSLYTSLTQLLLRRSQLERIGLFRTDLGSHADFEWGVRAGLLTDVLHVPSTRTAWRVHGRQETDLGFLDSAAFYAKLQKMAKQAFRIASQVEPSLRRFSLGELMENYAWEQFRLEWLSADTRPASARLLARWLLKRPSLAFEFLRHCQAIPPGRQNPLEPVEFCHRLIARYGLENNLKAAKTATKP
jgi:glycosyltransferase involved in cell wall biosynthesis